MRGFAQLWVKLLLWSTVSVHGGHGDEKALLKLPLGLLRGVYRGEHAIFRGIPFAKPPVGKLRFAPPVAWSRDDSTVTKRDAWKAGVVCPQASLVECLHP